MNSGVILLIYCIIIGFVLGAAIAEFWRIASKLGEKPYDIITDYIVDWLEALEERWGNDSN